MTVAIGSMAGFLAAVEDRMKITGSGSEVWFRGQEDYHKRLEPKARRTKFQPNYHKIAGERGDKLDLLKSLMDLERKLFSEFERRAWAILPRQLSTTDLYFLAQHHGLPTRLLDWTESPLAALYFAVSKEKNSDGAIFVANPGPHLSTSDMQSPLAAHVMGAPFLWGSDKVKEALRYILDVPAEESPSVANQVVLPVKPPLSAGRMLEQKACFTLHMPHSRSIDDGAVDRWIINASAKRKLRQELRFLGVQRSTLFPDLDNIAGELEEKTGLSRLWEGYSRAEFEWED